MEDQSENIAYDETCASLGRITLVQICYLIAIIDLAQSLYFLVQSIDAMGWNVGIYSIVVFLGSIFWIIMVILLLMGLWKHRIRLICCWLIFSIIGIIVDILIFIWTISVTEYVEWPKIIQFTLIYLGIVLEWLCIYIVYRYCLSIVRVQFEENGSSNKKKKLSPHKNQQKNQKEIWKPQRNQESVSQPEPHKGDTVIYIGAPK
ncbi:uncharacterized protein LOC108650314 [Drosophila navojoa]|uniref:uncharacterized protein LOC108650314 n=1 Tax=Drosophila navojoa TaxID=7232 RepID=UPI0008474E94|nr:uncharacterized protein LOC108650314 [Drosophila navojoa]